jgi:hypothetical protein
VTINAGLPPRQIIYRWRTSEDDERDAERAEAQRLRDEGKHVASIGWDDPEGGKLIEHGANQEPYEQGLRSGQRPVRAGGSADLCRSTSGWREQIEWAMFERVDTPLCGIRAGLCVRPDGAEATESGSRCSYVPRIGGVAFCGFHDTGGRGGEA